MTADFLPPHRTGLADLLHPSFDQSQQGCVRNAVEVAAQIGVHHFSSSAQQRNFDRVYPNPE